MLSLQQEQITRVTTRRHVQFTERTSAIVCMKSQHTKNSNLIWQVTVDVVHNTVIAY